MGRNKGRRTTLIALAIAIILIALVGTVLLIKAIRSDDPDPYRQTDITNQAESDENADVTKDADSTKTPSEDATKSGDDSDNSDAGSLDPAAVSTIDIAPLDLTVSYVKGVGGFAYEVLRTPSGIEYVEFRSEALVGTKCTDDEGAFVSILVNPQASEGATLTKTKEIGGVKYGLSLVDATCTRDKTKLQQYQKSFSDAFSLLKKADA